MPYNSTILITGGTSGLGYHTALSLSKSLPSSQIVITGRTLPPDALAQAANPNIVFIPLDLSTHAGAREFVKTYASRNFPPISALLLNAGMQTLGGIQYSSDGIEIMFAVNHVNHALLFFLLSGHLAPHARVVSVASSTHDPAFKRVPDPSYTTAENAARKPTGSSANTRNEAFQRYALSKLANVFFTYALYDWTKKNRKGWVVTALDPGVMPTKLYRHTGGVMGAVINWAFSSWLTRQFMHDLYPTEYTAATLAQMATAERFGAEDVNGKYFAAKEGKEMRSSEKSYDKVAQRDLWEWTVNEVLREEERAKWAW
jgi:NAD(P)-dependent dehydrogenase (short-subunit alcohol dehydrogenase family)